MLTYTNHQYENLLRNILIRGTEKSDRTGTGTRSIFGAQLRYDLQHGFPLITTKHVSFKNIKAELLWFLSGSTNIKWLQEQNVHIWDEWADADGELGPVYGSQWRRWEGFAPWDDNHARVTVYIDQIANAIETIKKNPDSRRIIVSAWNVGEIDQMKLPPCHAFFQFYVADGKLSCQLYQRSADMFLGVPYNIASYSLLTHMIAKETGLEAGDFVWTGGDCHIYDNHVEQVKEQLTREILPFPALWLSDKPETIDDWGMDDIDVINYRHHPKLTGKVAV